MSVNDPGVVAEPVVAQPQREADDDHDLLTYGEARVRLFEEVETQRALVAELQAGDPAERLGKENARLAALEAALQRNRRAPITDENFERFFGYKGTARRNT